MDAKEPPQGKELCECDEEKEVRQTLELLQLKQIY